MTNLKQKWLQTVNQKNSLLCVGIDPAELGQRDKETLAPGESKLKYTLDLIEKVAPYTSCIKPNRNYFKDFSREEMITLNKRIHELGMLSIDDSKLADIGETNDAGFYHAQVEGFDFVTYAPFPGNVASAAKQAKARSIGLITLVLMSNPEYRAIKEATIGGMKGYEYFATLVQEHDGEGIVIGAPSPTNHITAAEVARVRQILGQRLVLVPGIGAQGGDIKHIIAEFGDLTIANVGRAIIYSEDPAVEARRYRDMLNQMRHG